MIQILKINRKNNSANILLSNDTIIVLSLELVCFELLYEGLEITEEHLDYLLKKDKVLAAKNSLFNKLSIKYLSLKESTSFLYSKKLSDEDIHLIIDDFVQKGYINDYKYVVSYLDIKKKMEGPLLLKHKLLAKGIKENLINDIINNIDINEWIKTVYDYYNLDSVLDYKKAYNKLYTKGFLYSDIINLIGGFNY
ncbi:MAG: RecX family transcriptional regulator [Acholeplasmatales bacterium]|jgi:regulatory protein|nr:RecX family transcriptional regulator [Acholeplasmatales bacterium]